uniref:Uncharacterized protein n=1 Tax=Rhizophora mucronata TaxID=61149 RepID=A0A2P2NEC4_RHIMU
MSRYVDPWECKHGAGELVRVSENEKSELITVAVVEQVELKEEAANKK